MVRTNPLKTVLKQRQQQRQQELTLPPAGHMTIMIKPNAGSRFEINVAPEDTILNIKTIIMLRTGNDALANGIPPELQHLRFQRKELLDRCTIASCGVGHGDELCLSRSWRLFAQKR